ncbi:MAG: sulfatase, partial [Lachnospiraceae bacterium]
QYSELRNQLHEVILERMNQTRDPYRGYQWRERSWRKNDVETLWAVDGYTRQRENEEYEPRQLDYNTGLPMTEAVRKKGK